MDINQKIITIDTIIILVLSILVILFYINFIAKKTKKILEKFKEIDNVCLLYEERINNIDKDSYSISKYNKATLTYIKEFRKILVKHKGKNFDTNLLNSIDREMQKEIDNEKYKNLDNFIPQQGNSNDASIDDAIEPPSFIEINKKRKKPISIKNKILNIMKDKNSLNRTVNNSVDNSNKLINPNKQMYSLGHNKNEIKNIIESSKEYNIQFSDDILNEESIMLEDIYGGY